MKFNITVLFVALFSLSFSAIANEEYVCNFGEEQRLISVAYDSDQYSVPCQVMYDKGQGAETLWNAQSEVGYCETKAQEFVTKQESWGWSCEKVAQVQQTEQQQSMEEVEAVQAEDMHSSASY